MANPPIRDHVEDHDNIEVSVYPQAPASSGIVYTRELASNLPTAASVTGLAPMQGVIDQAFQRVLGRVPRSGDYRSFEMSLTQSFKFVEKEGRRVAEWVQPLGRGQTDLGGSAVTGAQAGLVDFAGTISPNILRQLDNLTPLTPDPDKSEIDAISSILRADWTSFVKELGRSGGARAARANHLARRIREHALPTLGALLGMVKLNASGKPMTSKGGKPIITRDNVVGSDDERALTSYMSLVNQVFAIFGNWEEYRDNFLQQDFGSGMVLLSRALQVVGESVQEVYDLMTAANIGESERETIALDLDPTHDDPGSVGYTNMTVEDLLSWIAEFPQEAAYLIQEGGLRGVETVHARTQRLNQLLDQFLKLIHKAKDAPRGSANDPMKKFSIDLILDPLEDLGCFLKQVEQYASQIVGDVDFAAGEDVTLGEYEPVRKRIEADKKDTAELFEVILERIEKLEDPKPESPRKPTQTDTKGLEERIRKSLEGAVSSSQEKIMNELREIMNQLGSMDKRLTALEQKKS